MGRENWQLLFIQALIELVNSAGPSLSNSAQPRDFSAIDPPLTQPRQQSMRQCRHVNHSSKSAGSQDRSVVLVLLWWGGVV